MFLSFASVVGMENLHESSASIKAGMFWVSDTQTHHARQFLAVFLHVLYALLQFSLICRFFGWILSSGSFVLEIFTEVVGGETSYV